ncbi:MAG TPA: DEAD/DEAH box helicase [Anaerolineae bacterium]|nr:DEAD/DEAH box helicase [Anaerolineae bacterium]
MQQNPKRVKGAQLEGKRFGPGLVTQISGRPFLRNSYICAIIPAMDTAAFVKQIDTLPGYRGQVVHVERLPARRARHGSLDRPLPPPLAAALRHAGVDRLYHHQAVAINAARAGQHVILSTGTASGKTLAYNVPVLEALLAETQARALYLFPTKALAHDQLRTVRELAAGDPALASKQFATYDGDTAQGARARLRHQASILLTNPDMLHLGILPNHTLWAGFFANLRYIVIDEAHAYRGVFGSHVGCLLRRLWRVCARYGAAPQIIACSATIANPGEHLQRLAGVEPVVVGDQDDGAPRGARDFILWNPPFVDRAQTARKSANIEAARLLARLVQSEIRTIAFTRARRVAELLLLYTRRILEDESPALAQRLRAYRAGYRPEERREIERGLRPGGDLLGVAATSALELGIDIGDLDASILVGYPGTIASVWQQAGRAGRGTRRALSVLVGLDNPLDQYFMRHPSELFGRPHEHALIDPSNPYILEQHLPCAAHEFPLSRGVEEGAPLPPPPVPARAPRRARPGRRNRSTPVHPAASPAVQENGRALPPGLARGDDEALFGPGFVPAMVSLEEAGHLTYHGDRWFPRAGAYPAEDVSLRALAGGRVSLLDATNNYRILEEIESTTAMSRAHPGAIYLHQGESFLVRELDLDVGHAVLVPVDVNYYTQPYELNDLRVVRPVAHKEMGTALATLGLVQVTQQVTGYRRVQQFSEDVQAIEELDLPAQTFQTVAVWWDLPPERAERLARRLRDPDGRALAGGLHAVEHAAIGLLPLIAMCDRWDIGGLSTPHHADTGAASVFIYDAFPGGVGIAEKGFDLLAELWQVTYETIRDCPCEDGCPSCIQSPKCGNNNNPLDKQAAVTILAELVKGS